jgi:hypothetical protein
MSLASKIHGATVVQYAHDIFSVQKFVATKFSITNNLCHLQLFVCFCDELIIGFKELFLFLFFLGSTLQSCPPSMGMCHILLLESMIGRSFFL